MDKSGVNIDILFRNGLKDFEVLPPGEVWNSIHPFVKKKKKPFILLRVAAVAVIVLSVGYLATRWNNEVPKDQENKVLALNMMAAAPIRNPASKIPFTEVHRKINLVPESQITISEKTDGGNQNASVNNLIGPVFAADKDSRIMSLNYIRTLQEPFNAPFKTTQDADFKIVEPEQQYLSTISSVNNAERWSIAAFATPTYYSTFNPGSNDLARQLKASEENLTSYSGGFAFSYKVNKRISIQSGIFYSSVGQIVDGINSFAGFQNYVYTKGDHNFEVLTSGGTIYTKNSDVFLIASGSGERVSTVYTNDVFDPNKVSLQYLNNTIRQNFSYLELPLIFRYKLVDKKVDFNLIGGLSYNMLVNNSAYTMVDGAKYSIGKTEGLNPVSLSSSLGMGMEYNFSTKLSLNLEPTFRYYLNQYNSSAGLNIHPYSFGLFSGVSYKF